MSEPLIDPSFDFLSNHPSSRPSDHPAGHSSDVFSELSSDHASAPLPDRPRDPGCELADLSEVTDPADLIDRYEPARAVPVATLTNSPGCEPTERAQAPITSPLTSPMPSPTPSPTCLNASSSPTSGSATAPTRRAMRTVRVDAWAEPAAASWSRTRKTVRKVSSPRTGPAARVVRTRSTDWALPF